MKNHLITMGIIALAMAYCWMVVLTDGLLLAATSVVIVVVVIYCAIYAAVKDYRRKRAWRKR